MVSSLYETNAAQEEGEIAWLVDIFKRENVRSYLEIGSKFGGSLWRVGRELPTGSRIVAVDMPKGTKAWKDSKPSLEACVDRLSGLGHSSHLIWGDSTEPAIVAQVQEHAPFDAVLIDANHTLPYVTKDYANYGELARLVAFHDIAWRRGPDFDGVRIDVPQFWDGIKVRYRHEEIRNDPKNKNNGIGVLWRC